MRKAIFGLLAIAMITSCVPARKYEEIKNKRQDCEEERAELKDQNRRLDEEFKEIQQENEKLSTRVKGLQNDTTVMGKSLRVLNENYDKLNESYQLLLDKNQDLLSGSQRETKQLFSDLQQSQLELLQQVDSLKRRVLFCNKSRISWWN